MGEANDKSCCVIQPQQLLLMEFNFFQMLFEHQVDKL